MTDIAYVNGEPVRLLDVSMTSVPIEIPPSGGREPDPKWRYTDAAGHEHYRAEHDWPTLEWVVDRTYWCEGCQDEHDEGHYACRVCGEAITPGSRAASPFSTFLPGPVDVSFKVAGFYSGKVNLRVDHDAVSYDGEAVSAGYNLSRNDSPWSELVPTTEPTFKAASR